MGYSNNIVQGDNNTILYFNIADETGDTDIFNNIDHVECKMTVGTTSSTKNCVIVDAASGRCSVTLSSADIATCGRYLVQLTLYYLDGSKFTTNISKFTVNPKL